MAANKVVWEAKASRQYLEILTYIAQDSVQNAEKVKDEIQQKLLGLLLHPKKYPPDKYKTNNNGNYRAFTVFQYRIAYLIKDTEVHVLSIRHSKMLPKQY